MAHSSVEHRERSASPHSVLSKTTRRHAQKAWRTVRQRRQGANGEKTAEQSNGESVALKSHARLQDDSELFPHGSAGHPPPLRVPQSLHQKSRSRPAARRSTVMPRTVTESSVTVRRTVREKRPPRTAWELPGLINRGAVRSPRQPTVGMQPWYANVVAYTHLSRFVTGSILRRRFPLWLSSDRTAQRHLANLVDRGLLATVSAWATGPNFPHVYQATPSGVRFV